MRSISLSAIYFCLFFLLNDVGPAHSRRLESRDNLSDLAAGGNRPTSVVKSVTKRGAGSTLVKYGFKVLRLGSEVLPKVSSMTFVVSAAYKLIVDCCDGKYGDACKWTKETQAIQKEIEDKGHEIDVIQLETKNLQDLLVSVNDQYDNIADQMVEISDESVILMNNLNANLADVLDETTMKLKKMIDEKSKEEDVEYADMVEDFFEKIDAATNIAVCSMELAVPALPKFSYLGKRNLARRKTFKLRKAVRRPLRIRDPVKGTPESKGLKSWLSKEKGFVKKKVTTVRVGMSIKFRGAVEKVKNFADKFGLLYGYVDAGLRTPRQMLVYPSMSTQLQALTLYAAIENFKKCRTANDEAKGAVEGMRKAKQELEGIYNNAVEARKIMFQARDQLKGNLTSDQFLGDLTSLKQNMIDIQGSGDGMQDMIDGVDAYIQDMKSTDDFEDVASLAHQLYTSLASFPFVYRCISTKVRFLSLAMRECKNGKEMKDIIDDNKNLFDVNNTDCEQRLGAGYLTPDVIQRVIEKAANKEGFNKVCALNSETEIEKICTVRCEGKGQNAEQIAEKVPWPVEEIKNVISKCGSCLEKKKGFICMAKLYKPDITDSELQKQFPMLSLKEISSVNCNEW